MPHNVVMAERCNWCSKQRPGYRTHKLTSGQVICDHCIDWHQRAWDTLGGAVPPGCQECDRSYEQLQAAVPHAIDVRMYIVQKDGIYQMLCEACGHKYVAKRADLYTQKTA